MNIVLILRVVLMCDIAINVSTAVIRIENIYSFCDSATCKRCTYNEVSDKIISTKINFCCLLNGRRFALLYPFNAKCIWVVWKMFIVFLLTRYNTAKTSYLNCLVAATIEYCCPKSYTCYLKVYNLIERMEFISVL